MSRSFDSFGGARKPPPNIAARASNGKPPQPPPELGKMLARESWDAHKPPTAQDFFTFTPLPLILPAGAGSTVRTTAATGAFMQLGADMMAKLENVTITINAPTLAMSFRFTVFVDGTGIPGLSNIGFPPVAASTFVLPINGVWQIKKGAIIEIQAVNLAAPAVTLGFVLSGYQVLESDVFAYTGERLGMIETHSEQFKVNLAR